MTNFILEIVANLYKSGGNNQENGVTIVMLCLYLPSCCFSNVTKEFILQHVQSVWSHCVYTYFHHRENHSVADRRLYLFSSWSNDTSLGSSSASNTRLGSCPESKHYIIKTELNKTIVKPCIVSSHMTTFQSFAQTM